MPKVQYLRVNLWVLVTSVVGAGLLLMRYRNRTRVLYIVSIEPD